MQVSVAFSGPAGTGIMTAGSFLGKLLSKKWYFVVWDKEYESIIKWWNNLFVLYISDEKNYISKKIDYLFYYNAYWLEKYESLYEVWKSFDVKKTEANYQNTLSIAMACKILWIDLSEIEDLYKEKFGSKKDVLEKNIEDLHKGFDMVDKWVVEIWDLGVEKEFLHGNEVIWIWAIDSGLEFYSAYPMTPASSIIDTIVKNKDVVFFQGEDEIAVSISMLWAHFTGKRAMCGTSGGWFALMTESISFSNQAELGGVYILSQRAWPSTGTPTYTEQADLNFALNASFGDTYPIVLAPSSFEDGYNLIGKALNWSDQYQHPVIYLVDKQYSECYLSVDPKKLNAESVLRGKRVWWEIWGLWEEWKKLEKFARYEVTEDGVSPYTYPWIKWWEFIATSYEHNIYWATSEDPLSKKVMTHKRSNKINKTFISEVFNDEFYWYEIINPDAKNFFVTFGINRIVLESFVLDNNNWWNNDCGVIIIKVLQPVDPRLAIFFEEKMDNIEQLVFVEQNYSWQFEQHIKTQCGLRVPERETKIENKRKYESYPFFAEDF